MRRTTKSLDPVLVVFFVVGVVVVFVVSLVVVIIIRVTACKRYPFRTPHGAINETQRQDKSKMYLWKEDSVYSRFNNRTNM